MEKDKIVLMAKIYGIASVILSIICGIAIWALESEGWSDATALDYLMAGFFEDGVSEFFIGLVVMAIGSVQGYLFYCFGEFMEKQETQNKTGNIQSAQSIQPVTSALDMKRIEKINALEKAHKVGLLTDEQYYKTLESLNAEKGE